MWAQGVPRTPNLRVPFTSNEKMNEGLSRIDEVLGPITGGVYSTDNRGKVFDSGGAVYNVKAPNFGAVGDGVTDDTTAVQKAINMGKDVYFPPGTYLVGDLTGTTNLQVFRGAGGYQTILKRKSGTTNILTNAGNFVVFEGITFRGRTGESNTNIVLNGHSWKLINCNSDQTDGYVLDATNPEAFLIQAGAYTTTGSGATMRIGSPTAATSSLYGRMTDVVFNKNASAVEFYACGTFSVVGGQIGGLTMADGSGGGTAYGLSLLGVRITGDVTLVNADNVVVGNKISSGKTITLGSANNFYVDNADSGVSIVNNGNANNVAIRQVSSGSTIQWKVGADSGTTSGTATYTLDYRTGGGNIALPGTVHVANNKAINIYPVAGTGNGLNLTMNASDNATITNAATGSMTFGTNGAGAVNFIQNGTTRFTVSPNLLPQTDNALTIGSAAQRASNIYGVIFRPGDGTPTWTSGAGTPEGAVTAVVGSLYTRTNGGASTTLYVKESGSGNTGWVAK